MQEIILNQRKSAQSAGKNSPQITRIYADSGNNFINENLRYQRETIARKSR